MARSTFNAVKNSVSIALGPLKAVVAVSASIKASMIAMGAASLKAASDYEMFNQQLRTVIKSRQEADRAFRESLSFSVKTPFTPEQIIRTRIALEGVGVKGQKAVKGVAEAAAALDRNILDVAAAVRSMEAEPIRNLGIMMDEINQRVGDGWRKSTEGFRQAQDELLKIFEERFGGSVDRMSYTFKGLRSTLTGVITDLRASFAEGFLGESKLFVNDLITAGENLKKHAIEAGKSFGDEMMYARSVILASFDVAVEAARIIKAAWQVDGQQGAVLLKTFQFGAEILGKGFIGALRVAFPMWKAIGQIIFQGMLEMFYKSNMYGAETARKHAIEANLERMPSSKLMATAQKLGVSSRHPDSWTDYIYRQVEGSKAKTQSEYIEDIAEAIQKKHSIEGQMAFVGHDPDKIVGDTLEQAKKDIETEVKAVAGDVLASAQKYLDSIGICI